MNKNLSIFAPEYYRQINKKLVENNISPSYSAIFREALKKITPLYIKIVDDLCNCGEFEKSLIVSTFTSDPELDKQLDYLKRNNYIVSVCEYFRQGMFLYYLLNNKDLKRWCELELSSEIKFTKIIQSKDKEIKKLARELKIIKNRYGIPQNKTGTRS